MKSLWLLVVSVLCATSAAGADPNASNPKDKDVVLRLPFTLRVPVDRNHYYEEKKGSIPYVYQGEVGLFIGDHFGIKIDVQHGAVRSVKYEPDLGSADITLQFKQG